MPLSKYFKGSGEKVMSAMKREYGSKKGESVFYATVNKQKKKKRWTNSDIEQSYTK